MLIENSETFKKLQADGKEPRHIFEITYAGERSSLDSQAPIVGKTRVELEAFPQNTDDIRSVAKDIATSLGYKAVFISGFEKVGLAIKAP